LAENKTTPTDVRVGDFLGAVEPAAKRSDALALDALFRRVCGEEPRMWGPTIVGYGNRHYRYASGREGDICRIGFSPRKAALVLYVGTSFPGGPELLARLGKYSKGAACIYVKTLADVDLGVLEALARGAFADRRDG
jgi:hypothetical protein